MQDRLNEARAIINEVDKEMAELFRRRMEAARMVGEYKMARGLPVLDEKREDELVRRNAEDTHASCARRWQSRATISKR